MINDAKLLIISSFADSLIRFRFDLIKDAIQKGFEVHVCAPDLTEEIQGTLEKAGAHVHQIHMSRTGINPLRDIRTLFSLRRLIKRIHPTHVLSYTIKPVVYGCLIARMCGVRRIYALITGLGYAFMDTSSMGQRIVGIIAKCLYRVSLNGCTKVFFQNPDDRETFKQLDLVKSEQSFVVNGSGVNIKQFPETLLPAGENIHFLLIARLIKDKGVLEYIEAAKQIKPKYPNTVFNLVGWFDTNPSAVRKELVQQWTEEGLIDFHGKLKDVRPAIANSHVYVLPSYREGTPRTVLEAMSMGRAIVTTDAPGCRETVEHGVNGLLCKVANVDSLVNALESLIVEPKLVLEFGQQSRLLAEQKYDVKRVNASMLSILAEV
jgi:glycosyltransferase involved in cell wall biosynthesis